MIIVIILIIMIVIIIIIIIMIMIIYNRQLISMYNQKTTQNKRTKKGQ